MYPPQYGVYYMQYIIVHGSCKVYTLLGDEIRRILLESVLPFLKELFLVKASKAKRDLDHVLVEYDLYGDYLEMVIQFGVSSKAMCYSLIILLILLP